MKEQEINQVIAEAMGKCWHEWQYLNARWSCLKCGALGAFDMRHIPKPNPSYTTSWADYGRALEWAMRQEWWDTSFISHLMKRYIKMGLLSFTVNCQIIWCIANPLRGSAALAVFLKTHKEVME